MWGEGVSCELGMVLIFFQTVSQWSHHHYLTIYPFFTFENIPFIRCKLLYVLGSVSGLFIYSINLTVLALESHCSSSLKFIIQQDANTLIIFISQNFIIGYISKLKLYQILMKASRSPSMNKQINLDGSHVHLHEH